MDLEYPNELHEEHNCHSLVPEKKVIEKRLMTVYLKRLMEDLKLDPPNSEKLVLTLEDKEITRSTTKASEMS